MGVNGKVGSRKRRLAAFPASAQKIFLTHLAETSNVSASARKAGVTSSFVYDRRRRSAVFDGAWHRALCEGYVRLETAMLEEALKAPSAKTSPAMQKARDAKNRIRAQLLAHHRAAVRGEGRGLHKIKDRKGDYVKTQIAERINQMRKNISVSNQPGA